MPQYSISTPASAITSETEPSASDYKFWIKSSTGEAWFSDGTTWTEIPTSGSNVSIAVVENALSILDIQAADTITPDTSAQIVSDVFFDADGYNGTIDTGNTTATFNTNLYENTSSETNDAHGELLGTDTAETALSGEKILTKTICKLVKVTKKASVTATKCKLYAANKTTLLDTQTFSGDVATFDYNLADATNYYIFVDSDGGSYTRSWNTGVTSPIVGTNINWIAGGKSDAADDDTRAYSIVSIDTKTFPQKIVQTNEQTLPSTPTKFLIFPFRDSGGTITADISFDSGANYQTAVAVETETTITNTGNGMILKINFAADSNINLSGYGVLFW